MPALSMKSDSIRSCAIGGCLHNVFKDWKSYENSERDWIRSYQNDCVVQDGLLPHQRAPLAIYDSLKVEDIGPVTGGTGESKRLRHDETVREDAFENAKINDDSTAVNHWFLDNSSCFDQFTLGVEDIAAINLQMAELDYLLKSNIQGFLAELVFPSAMMEGCSMIPSLEETINVPFDQFKGFGANSLPTLLPQETSQKHVTLVLDLDETLVHSTTKPSADADFSFRIPINSEEKTVYVRWRPFLKVFLERVSKMFEIILFTASQRTYAGLLLNRLDPEGKFFSRSAFQDSRVLADGIFTKDLTVLGVDLAKVAIVDNAPEVYRWQVNNGIPIKSWYEDPSVSELMNLLPFLETLVGIDKVRPIITPKLGGTGQR